MTDHAARVLRLADWIKQIVAQLLERRIKDPRLGFVTVTDVRLTNDMREATVFYTVLGDEEESAASAAALGSARGMIRSEVGRITGVRFTPTIAFVPDALPTTAAHIEDLLRQAAVDDARVHEQAASGSFAGDPEPYRVPEEEDSGGIDPA
jgi:ribosome-binding factor A